MASAAEPTLRRSRRRRVVLPLVGVLLVLVAVWFNRVRYWATGRNPCGQRPVPADVVEGLGDSVTILSREYVDECTTANYATIPTQTYAIRSRSSDALPQQVVEAALTSAGWHACPWQPNEGCVQSASRHYHAVVTTRTDGTVTVIVMDTRNEVDCSRGCG